uniref:Uncharacterized protein n=1 Tax=Anguilla anguilla TaxID=7936 RepID=A0A0E9SVT5_ANGAN
MTGGVSVAVAANASATGCLHVTCHITNLLTPPTVH